MCTMMVPALSASAFVKSGKGMKCLFGRVFFPMHMKINCLSHAKIIQYSNVHAIIHCHSNNMLYPKEDKDNKILLYACRNCDYKQEADSNCIYVNKIMHEIEWVSVEACHIYCLQVFKHAFIHYHSSELTHIVPDVISDPTLPRTEDHACPKCGHREAVFFQAQTRRAEEEMRLYYVCTNQSCTHRWTE